MFVCVCVVSVSVCVDRPLSCVWVFSLCFADHLNICVMILVCSAGFPDYMNMLKVLNELERDINLSIQHEKT